MVLHTHAECIDKDCYHYPSVEVLAVHNPPQNGSGIMKAHTHTVLILRLLFFHILVTFALFQADIWPLLLWVRFTVGVAINTVTFLGTNWAGGRLWRHQPHPAVCTHTQACARIHTCSEGQCYLILSRTGASCHRGSQWFVYTNACFLMCLYKNWLSTISTPTTFAQVIVWLAPATHIIQYMNSIYATW